MRIDLKHGRESDRVQERRPLARPSDPRCRGPIAALLACVAALSGCGPTGSQVGSPDVASLGMISGRVITAQRESGSPTGALLAPLPLSGASVVLLREVPAPTTVLGTTTTTADGTYHFSRVEPGSYYVAFPEDALLGASSTSSGSTTAARDGLRGKASIRLERGSFASAPDLIRERAIVEGSATGTVNVRLLDALSGLPVTVATVAIGSAGVTGTSSSGVFPVQVKASRDPRAVAVDAEGYERVSEYSSPESVAVDAGESVTRTIHLKPRLSKVTGTVRIRSNPQLYRLEGLTVSTAEWASSLISGTVNSMGSFSIDVPASTSTRSRSLTLVFSSRTSIDARVPGFTSPLIGAVSSIPEVIELTPKTFTITGRVKDSSGNLPAQTYADQLPDAVRVTETGQQGIITNGFFALHGVPMPDSRTGPSLLTLEVSVYNPSRSLPRRESTSKLISSADIGPSLTLDFPDLETW